MILVVDRYAAEGCEMLGSLADRILTDGLGFDPRTSMYLRFDLRRLYTRLRHHRRQISAIHPKLHLGCGGRKVAGWLNCDITDSDYNVDLAASSLPFKSNQFTVIVAQQVFEHLDFDPIGLRFLRECHRIMQPSGQFWLSCPDLEKMCVAYVTDRCRKLDYRQKRHSPAWQTAPGFPVQHRINFYFHQWGEHRNLFDFEMLQWALEYTGFNEVVKVQDADLPAAYPEFPSRNDDFESVLVKAIK